MFPRKHILFVIIYLKMKKIERPGIFLNNCQFIILQIGKERVMTKITACI